MPVILWWKRAGWPWLKKHWKWFILFPFMLVVWLYGKRSGRVTVVSDDAESDAAKDFRDRVRADADRKVAKLDEARQEGVDAAMDVHKVAVAEHVASQKDDTEELMDDPQKLNSFLQGVGKRQRE